MTPEEKAAANAAAAANKPAPPRPHLSDKIDEWGGLTILGQTLVFPKTGWGGLTAAAICLAIIGFAWVVLHAPKENLEMVAGFILMKVDPKSGQATKEPKTLSYGFWTPSKDTKSVLQQMGDVPSDKKWVLESEVTDKTLNDFGEALRSSDGVEGYRRNEIWGQGRAVDDKVTPPVPGWWWTVRTKKKFTIEELSQLYNKHWHTKNWTLYVEVLDGAGAFK